MLGQGPASSSRMHQVSACPRSSSSVRAPTESDGRRALAKARTRGRRPRARSPACCPDSGSPEGLDPSLFSNDESKESRFVREPRSGARAPLFGRPSRSRARAGPLLRRRHQQPGRDGRRRHDPLGRKGARASGRQDFEGLSSLRPGPGANVADWPLDYADLAPFYDVVEAQLGVQGDLARCRRLTLAQAPQGVLSFRSRPDPLMLAASLPRGGAVSLGYHAYPFPMAVTSQPYGDASRCNSCGFCSGFGCPINARGSAAVSFLHPAMRQGVRGRAPVRFVLRIDVDADRTPRHRCRATSTPTGIEHRIARRPRGRSLPSAIETARLLLLSKHQPAPRRLGNRSGQLGRNLMFHLSTLAVGDLRARGPCPGAARRPPSPSTTSSARSERVPRHRTALPQRRALRGGRRHHACIQEAELLHRASRHRGAPAQRSDARLTGAAFSCGGCRWLARTCRRQANRVDLDPHLRDVHGVRSRASRTPRTRFELRGSDHFGPQMAAFCRAAPGLGRRRLAAAWARCMASTGGFSSPYAGPAVHRPRHGHRPHGRRPRDSVVDGTGRVHDLDNVYVDGRIGLRLVRRLQPDPDDHGARAGTAIRRGIIRRRTRSSTRTAGRGPSEPTASTAGR